MKRFFKRTLAVLIAVIMLVGVAPLGIIDLMPDASAKTIADCSVGDIITFGSYPQSRVTNSQLVITLTNNNPVNSSWVSYGYYSGTGDIDDGNMAPSDYMKYKDVTYNGVKYRGVYFTSYRPWFTGYTSSTSNTYQDDNGYYTNKAYWFKYEPLTWRVLDPSEGFVMCNKAIDAQAYQNFLYLNSTDDEYYNSKSCTNYASDWATSSIREWLNDDFYNTAFTASEKSKIGTSHLENKSTYSSTYNSPNTYDKIFLLSYWDVINSSYGFNSIADRQIKSTDYAQAQGCYKSTSYYGNSWWRLRSPYYSDRTAYVYGGGNAGSDYHYDVDGTGSGVVPAFKFNPKSTISSSGIVGGNSSSSLSASIDSIKIIPRKADASIKINVAEKDINFILNDVTAVVGGKTFTQDNEKCITIPSSDVTGDITIKRSGYNDYVIPLEVYNSFSTTSLDNILDYEAYMTKYENNGRAYISSVFGRVSGNDESYIDVTRNMLKITADESYDFYITARNNGSNTAYCITQDNAHKLDPQASGKFTSTVIGSELINGKTTYAYVKSGGKNSALVPLLLDVEQETAENPFIRQLKQGTLSLGGEAGLSIKVPESWLVIGGAEVDIVDFNFPLGVDITGNKVRASVGFDLWNSTTTESSSYCAVDPTNQHQIDKMTYIKNDTSGVIVDGMWETVKKGLKDTELSWKNAKNSYDKTKVKQRLADRYGLSINDLSSSNKKTTGFDASALGYIEGEIIGGKFIMKDFMISVSGSFTLSYTQQFPVGYVGFEGGGSISVSFNVARGVADQNVDFDITTGVTVTPTVTGRAGLGWDKVASLGIYGSANLPISLTFAFKDKTLKLSAQVNGEIGYEAQLLIFKTGRKPLFSGTAGPWSHTWRFGSNKSMMLDSFVNPDLFENNSSQTDEPPTFGLTERKESSAWLSGTPKRKTRAISVESGINITPLQTNVFENSDAQVVSCGNTTMAVWSAEDTLRDDYNRLKLVYSLYNSSTDTWSEPKAVYDDGHMDAKPHLTTDGENIYVAWQKYTKTFNETNSVEMADILDCSEIYLAKYDAATDSFIQTTRLTNNSVFDYAPTIVIKNGEPNVFYATNTANAIISAGTNSISKYCNGSTSVVASSIATVNAIEGAVIDNEIQIAYSTDTDGDIQTTNDINTFYGSDSFTAVPKVSESADSGISNFTYSVIDGETKLIYSDGVNIYYESEGKAVPILENDTFVSSKITSITAGNSTNLYWLTSTDAGNEIVTASYENGKWSDVVALTQRNNEFSNLALTYTNNTLLGVANETAKTYNSETQEYTKGESNFVFIRVNDFVDLKAESIEVIEYDRKPGEMTGISVNVKNNGNVAVNRLYFDISDSNGFEKTYYIDAQLIPGKAELCWLPYEIGESFAGSSISVRVYDENEADISTQDNTVTYIANKASVLASDKPVTYFDDGCIVSAEIVNYNFTDAEEVQAYISFEENGEFVSDSFIGTIDKNSKATVEFAYPFDELTFDENGIAMLYMTVTAANSESCVITYIVEKSDKQCAHPIVEDLGQIDPSCTQVGHRIGTVCVACKEYTSGGEEIPATGHTEVIDEAIPSTCTQTGLSEGKHCSVCEEVLVAQKTVDELGHNFNTSAITTQPDCTNTGVRTYYCSRCEATKTGTVPANGHIWVNGTITDPATCTETGTISYACENCTATKDEVMQKIAHTDANGDSICDICKNNVSDILPGETKSVTIKGGEITYLRFVPTVSGRYTITSVSSDDTYGYLYDANKSQITSNDDGGENTNFLISYDLIMGQEYYFGCRFYSSSKSGSYNVKLTLNSVLETLTPNENTTTVIDTINGYIYGINPKTTNINDCFAVKDGYTCESVGSFTDSNNISCYGTGSTFTVKSNQTAVAKYTLLVFGDVNGDGWYDGMDAVTVSCIANGLLTEEQIGKAKYMAADCNHDGLVDAADVSILEQAGILLADIDQTKTQTELAADSAYVEYCELIDQQPPMNEEQPQQQQKQDLISMIISIIEQIFKYVSAIISKVF